MDTVDTGRQESYTGWQAVGRHWLAGSQEDDPDKQAGRQISRQEADL